MKAMKIRLDRVSLLAAAGLSIFLGYFLFWFVEALVATFLVCILVRSVRRRKITHRRHVPPDIKEDRRTQDEGEE
jgi:hypothetical protein